MKFCCLNISTQGHFKCPKESRISPHAMHHASVTLWEAWAIQKQPLGTKGSLSGHLQQCWVFYSRNQVEPPDKSISQAYWVTSQAALQAGTRCQAGLQVSLDGAITMFPSAVGNPAWSPPPAPAMCSFTTRCFPGVCSCLWYPSLTPLDSYF